MSKNRIKIMSFFLLGTLLMTSCHREGKGELIEEPEYTNGAYAEYPFEPTTTTTEIIPTFSEELTTSPSEYVPPVEEETPVEGETPENVNSEDGTAPEGAETP